MLHIISNILISVCHYKTRYDETNQCLMYLENLLLRKSKKNKVNYR